ncbi:DUF4252 domain-containing protein [Carboxylicivirga caseinilyticus]|uniref:DUF4252 domain-containing protein n=1 Tax=Carboxylicivirga caseinilyticus TaxID=3417572 RepID=UPI003D341C22|nr:DUF4252 domain-containing protein [Marinilabiliaceae bacterium A049]
MKTISFIIVALLTINLSVNAQSRPSDRLFEKLALQKGITMLSFSKEMLDAVNMNFDNDKGDKENKVTGDLHEVKVVIYKAPETGESIDFRGEALRYLPLNKFRVIDAEEYEIDNKNGTVDIRVNGSGRKIKECHLLFQGETNGVLLSFFGDFKVEDVKEMAEKLDDYK